MEEKKIVVYVLHGFWENEFTNGCAVVDVSIDLETVMKKLDEIWYREDWYLEDLEEAIRSTGLEVTQERVDKLLEECHRIFDDKSERNEMLVQKASELFEEE